MLKMFGIKSKVEKEAEQREREELHRAFQAQWQAKSSAWRVDRSITPVEEATLTGHRSCVCALAVLPDGHLASASWDRTIKVWTVLGGEGRCEAALRGHGSYILALTVLPDGHLASGSADHTIKMWDVGFRPVNENRSTTFLHAAAGKLSGDEGETVPKKVGKLLPALSGVNPSPPPNNGKGSGDNAGSERDTLGFSGLSLSQGINIIAFSELALGEELGRGGFGVVFAAVWQGATQVAVKQLLGRLTSDLLEEFQRETAVHARLRHPNILMLYGVCMEPLRIAMVMEFMAQGSLYDVLRKPAELAWSLRLSFALDMVSGLLYLHGQHIIHRDLKSLNILVDGQNRAKVSDFGLSKIKLTTSAMTEGIGGTQHWMAPELFHEAANSEVSDVYATGVVFWEIAARKLPYEGKTLAQIMQFIDEGGREPIPEGMPSQFATLMTRCWAQRAEDRPSMNDVARDLRAMSGSASALLPCIQINRRAQRDPRMV